MGRGSEGIEQEEGGEGEGRVGEEECQCAVDDANVAEEAAATGGRQRVFLDPTDPVGGSWTESKRAKHRANGATR